jgi:DNA-binding CsgD family transcriptional regulator
MAGDPWQITREADRDRPGGPRRQLGDPLSPRQAQVVALYAAGHRTHWIVKKLGISRQAVNEALHHAREKMGRAEVAKLGVPSRDADFDWTDAAIAMLRELWAEGMPTKAIGLAIGVSNNAVIGKAHRLGLEPRPPPIRRRPD